MDKKTTILMIMDGWGLGKKYEGNAVFAGDTPNFDKMMSLCPNTRISASGRMVGLPEGQMGNSEVGHLNIGSGRIVYQELTRISKSIEDKEIDTNEALNNAMENAAKNKKKLHFMGLLSDGGVHSLNKHLYYLLEMAAKKGLSEVYIHCFMDGRDTLPHSGIDFIRELTDAAKDAGAGKIATIMGRYYAMDRDNRWERTRLAYEALTKGKGKINNDPVAAMEETYNNEVTDEFVKPVIVDQKGMIENGDSIVFFNFRPDRARQITRAFADDNFTGFEREKIETTFVCMTQYDAAIKNVEIAFKPSKLNNTLGEYLSSLNMKQLRIAETEKYAHVTFFFNGGVEEPNEGEDRILIPSPKVSTYDLQPEMSAAEVKEEVLRQLKREIYDVIIINFANPDMVGHTGVLAAGIKAAETVDKCLGEIWEICKEKGYTLLVTADHGNCEEMTDPETGNILTQHSLNKVPLIISGAGDIKLKEGKLADIAPTMLDLMNLDKPEEMTGQSLIKNT